jgi:predicted amidohydrolase YtcJ
MHRQARFALTAVLLLVIGCYGRIAGAADAELILHHGKIVTVDKQFSIRQAIAVASGRIAAVGDNATVMKLRGPATKIIDLAGKMVLPGLIDSHSHPTGASVTELDHELPDFETIQNVLDYIEARTKVVPPGQWIILRQVFITRLREQRYPTRAELDRVAPRHPVLYGTGPDASVNSLALQLAGIDKNFRMPPGEPGFPEKDPQTGEPTGILRRCTHLLKARPTAKNATEADYLVRLPMLFRDYNSVGLTTIGDRDSSPATVARYVKLHQQGTLSVRIAALLDFSSSGPLEDIEQAIRKAAEHPQYKDKNGPVRVIGVKTYLDGGMLTGSAYMLQPWGVSKIYSITDPAYRGVLFIPRERLLPMVRTAVECDLQFSAHTVGDGAVQALLDVYEEVNKTRPIRDSRPCISHSNFMSPESVERYARLGVCPDMQPAWLYLDTRTLVQHFGYDRLRWFQPLRSLFEAGAIAGGGSDHMQKIGSLRSNNPYDPLLGIWTTITRRARWYEGQFHPEESLSREQAIRFYTWNNAYLLRMESQVGSLEPGKCADLIVLDRDLLTCPVDDIRAAQVLATYLDGRPVFERK